MAGWGSRQAIVNFAGNRVAFGSVGVGYGNLLASITGKGVILHIINTLNQEVVISLDGGTTDWGYLPAGVSTVIDLGGSGAVYKGTVSVKHNGTAPTSGAISASIIRIT